MKKNSIGVLGILRGVNMTIKFAALSAAAVLAVVGSTPALAVTNFFTNFDSYAVASGGYVVIPTVEGWTATTGAGIELQNNAAGSPFSASNLVELDSFNNTTMSRMIDAGSYTLSYYYSPRPSQPVSTNGIEVLLGSTVIGAISGLGGSNTVWTQYTATFTTSTATMLHFRAVGTDDSLGGYIDDISLEGRAVPEPTTWAMMVFGFGLAGFAMRRRQVALAAA